MPLPWYASRNRRSSSDASSSSSVLELDQDLEERILLEYGEVDGRVVDRGGGDLADALGEIAEVRFAGEVEAERQGGLRGGVAGVAQGGGADGDVVLRGEPAEHGADAGEHRHQRADTTIPTEREHGVAQLRNRARAHERPRDPQPAEADPPATRTAERRRARPASTPSRPAWPWPPQPSPPCPPPPWPPPPCPLPALAAASCACSRASALLLWFLAVSLSSASCSCISFVTPSTSWPATRSCCDINAAMPEPGNSASLVAEAAASTFAASSASPDPSTASAVRGSDPSASPGACSSAAP